MVKGKAANWLHSREVSFPAFLDWSVRNWTAIIAKGFKWMKDSLPPAIPDIGFVLHFLSHFAEVWGEGKLEEWMTSPERTEVERLLAAGRSPEEAAAEIGRRRAIEGMKDEIAASKVEVTRRLRRAQIAEETVRRIEAIAAAPRRPRPEPLIDLRKPTKNEVMDWSNIVPLDPNWEPPEMD